MKALKPYLGILDTPDEHHETVEGSCEWMEAREDFQDWRDTVSLEQDSTFGDLGPGPKDSINILGSSKPRKWKDLSRFLCPVPTREQQLAMRILLLSCWQSDVKIAGTIPSILGLPNGYI